MKPISITQLIQKKEFFKPIIFEYLRQVEVFISDDENLIAIHDRSVYQERDRMMKLVSHPNFMYFKAGEIGDIVFFFNGKEI